MFKEREGGRRREVWRFENLNTYSLLLGCAKNFEERFYSILATISREKILCLLFCAWLLCVSRTKLSDRFLSLSFSLFLRARAFYRTFSSSSSKSFR